MAAISVRDDRGRAVVLTAERWAHILERHPDMAGRLGDIRAAVEAPEAATYDAEYPHREIFYRRPDGRRLFVRVVVGYQPVPPQGTWAGRIVTAHQTSHIDGKELPR